MGSFFSLMCFHIAGGEKRRRLCLFAISLWTRISWSGAANTNDVWISSCRDGLCDEDREHLDAIGRPSLDRTARRGRSDRTNQSAGMK